MIRLLYFSQARPELHRGDLDKILISSRKSNKILGITGVLAHGGGAFMQLLEGPEQVVIRTYVKILEDKRHTDSRIIHISPAKERMFAHWSMGLIERDPLSFEHFAKLRAHRLETVNSEAFQLVMREFDTMLVGSES